MPMQADACLSGFAQLQLCHVIYEGRVYLEKTILFLPHQPYRCGQFVTMQSILWCMFFILLLILLICLFPSANRGNSDLTM